MNVEFPAAGSGLTWKRHYPGVTSWFRAALFSILMSVAAMTFAQGAPGALPAAGLDADGISPVRIVTPAAPASAVVASRGAPAARPALPALPPNEFQKYVLEATGRLLPVFGSDFFASGTAVPGQAAPVPMDYPLGPGDEILVRAWGSIDVDLRLTIDRNGLVSIPRVGAVTIAGVRAGQAEEAIRTAMSRVFRGFSLNVTVGQLRGITVYVVGQARKPGTYQVSSVSTLVSVLLESGGPGSSGSMRRIEVRRSGKSIAEMDFYTFLAKGDRSADVRLIDGDVVVVHPATGHVALTGKVESPAVIEIRNNDTIADVLELVGGVPVLADPRRAFIDRLDPARTPARFIEEFALDAAGRGRRLQPGDVVQILPVTPEFANAVTLRGAVNQALRVPFRSGMRVTDLIPSREFLISSHAVRQQNRALVAQERRDEEIRRSRFPEAKALLDSKETADKPPVARDAQSFVDTVGRSYEDINWEHAVVERLRRQELSSQLLPFNLGKALADPKSPDNLPLQPGDTVTVFSSDDIRIPANRRQVVVRIEGEVRRPGVYPVETGETLVNLIEKAGGPTADAYLFGAEFVRESVRRSQQENLERFIQRLEQQALSDSGRVVANVGAEGSAAIAQAKLAAEAEARKSFVARLRGLKSNGRMSLNLPARNPQLAQLPPFKLEAGDRLVIPQRPDAIQVFGAVNTESALLWQAGRSVGDIVERAGLTRDADRDGIFVMRADGSVLSNNDRWFSSVLGQEVLPGDVVVVPEKFDKETFWTLFMRGAKDITQVLANFGLGAAAIKTLK